MDLITLILACSIYPQNAVVDAMIQIGSKNNPLLVTVQVPGQKNITKSFKSINTAAKFTETEVNKGYNVEIGLMQIPYHWIKEYKERVNLEELFRPCKNVVIATEILNHAARYCAARSSHDETCALSIYKSGDVASGQSYAEKVLHYAELHQKESKKALLLQHNENSYTVLQSHPPEEVKEAPITPAPEEEVGLELPPPSLNSEP